MDAAVGIGAWFRRGEAEPGFVAEAMQWPFLRRAAEWKELARLRLAIYIKKRSYNPVPITKLDRPNP
jgi:hypothetical protein